MKLSTIFWYRILFSCDSEFLNYACQNCTDLYLFLNKHKLRRVTFSIYFELRTSFVKKGT